MCAVTTLSTVRAAGQEVVQPDVLTSADAGESEGTAGHAKSINKGGPAEAQGEQLKAVSPALSIEELSVQARDRVEKIIRHLLIEGGIKESEVQMPSVRVSADEKTSSYRPKNNEIIIHAKSFDCIHTYGEEIFHWLRTQIKPEQERTSNTTCLPRIERFAAEEFFGFVGRAVVIRLYQSNSFSDSSTGHGSINLEKALTEYHERKDRVDEELTRISDFRLTSLTDFANHLDQFVTLSRHEKLKPANIFQRVLTRAAGISTDMREDFGPSVPESDPRGYENKLLLACELFSKKATQELSAVYFTQGDAFDSVVRKLGDLAVEISPLLKSFVANTDARYEDLIASRESADTHLMGYSAGLRFLQREGDTSAKIFEMLRAPTEKIYFEHVFERKDGGSGGSWLSGLVTRIKDYLAIRREQRRMAGKVKEEIKEAKSGFNSYTEEGRAAAIKVRRLIASLPKNSKYRSE